MHKAWLLQAPACASPAHLSASGHSDTVMILPWQSRRLMLPAPAKTLAVSTLSRVQQHGGSKSRKLLALELGCSAGHRKTWETESQVEMMILHYTHIQNDHVCPIITQN